MIKYFKYFLLLTLFSQYLPQFLYPVDSNFEDDPKINIGRNSINNIALKENEEKTLSLSNENNQESYLSIRSLESKKFNITSDINKVNKNEIDMIIENLTSSDFEGKNQILTISSNYSHTIEVIHIVKDKYSEYYNIIEQDDKDITIKNYSFVKFIDNETNEIKVGIKFKNTLNKANFHYGIVSLSSNCSYLIPQAFNFGEGIEKKGFQNEITIEKEDIDKIPNPKGHLAFIFTLESTENFEEYEVIINKDIMNYFLIGSIIIALIFAVITFFLIRRKQNIKNNDFYNEDNKEDQKEGKED